RRQLLDDHRDDDRRHIRNAFESLIGKGREIHAVFGGPLVEAELGIDPPTEVTGELIFNRLQIAADLDQLPLRAGHSLADKPRLLVRTKVSAGRSAYNSGAPIKSDCAPQCS